MNLIIDIGNTSTKAALIEKGLIIHGDRESCGGPLSVRRTGHDDRSIRYWF